MLKLTTMLRVDGIKGKQIFDFLANPNDQAYHQWWPGTHLQLHPLKRTEDRVGDVIYMDEYIGERRVRARNRRSLTAPSASTSKPVRSQIPVVLGGNSDSALRRAAGCGNGWYRLNLPSIEAAAERTRSLRARARGGTRPGAPAGRGGAD